MATEIYNVATIVMASINKLMIKFFNHPASIRFGELERLLLKTVRSFIRFMSRKLLKNL